MVPYLHTNYRWRLPPTARKQALRCQRLALNTICTFTHDWGGTIHTVFFDADCNSPSADLKGCLSRSLNQRSVTLAAVGSENDSSFYS